MKTDSFVLITTAKDEEQFLVPLIESILNQTRRPAKWVIVDDGSKDGSREIIERFAKLHDFILPMYSSQQGGARSFGSKAIAFSKAYEGLKHVQHDFVGTLDADVTLPPRYYEIVLERMRRNYQLGAAAGALYDKYRGGFKRLISSPSFPAGPVVFFRRECWEQIGGYQSVTVGGVDSISVQKARYYGWETREFDDFHALHHKPTGAKAGSGMRRCYRDGQTEYYIGTHPLFAIMKAVRRIGEKPYLIGSICRLIGFFQLWLKGARRDVSKELVDFLAKEQMGRLWKFIMKQSL